MTANSPPRGSLAVVIGLSALLISCSSPTETVSPAQATSPTASASAAASVACSSAAATRPVRPGDVTSRGTIWAVASGLDQPDDLLWTNGSLLIANMGSGTVDRLDAGGLSTLPLHLAGLEAMAAIGPKLYVAGQTQDAVFEWLGGTALRTVIQLAPVPGQAGVDGISAQNGLLIVPDSPRGVVDWVDPATGRIERQVRGFTRPTGVWPAPDGSVLIADEFGGAVVRVAPDGRRTDLARGLAAADDVVEDSGGGVFAVTATAPNGRLVQLVNGSVVDLAGRLQGAQGLAVDDADNLYVSEAGTGRVDVLIRTFKLIPQGPVPPSTQGPLCIDVERAHGFTDDIALQASPGLEVVQQPGSGSRGAVIVDHCDPVVGCLLAATAGNRRDVLRIFPST